MSEMVERVAAAIAKFAGDAAMKHNLAEISQSDQFEAWRSMYPIKVTDHDRNLARAAIEAMREPTDAMCEAAEWHQQSEVNQYQDAIDAALLQHKP